MTDIVQRLRGRPAPGDHCSKLIAEAADEIERLTAEFELFREAPSKLEVAQYEIERLRAELEVSKSAGRKVVLMLDEAREALQWARGKIR